MISKLKRQFVLINMGFVSIVLVAVLVIIGLISYQRVKEDSLMSMEKALSREIGTAFPAFEIGGKRPEKRAPLVPVFTVLLDENRHISAISKENVSITESLVSEITDQALEAGKQNGVLLEYELRFMLRNTPDGLKIAFADMDREIQTMTNLLFSLLLVGIGALGAFFVVSIYLSKWALKPVEAAWEKQKRFVADASHELKTPLTVILANSGILLSHKEDTIANQAKWVEYTQVEAERMKKLVDELLFLAKYDSDHRPELKAHVNISDALWSCLLPFESVAYEKGIEMAMDIEPDLTLPASESQLKQLAVIMIDNACKYAGENGRISVRLNRLGDQINLSVTNTGAVISEDQMAHIFDRFYRIDSSRARDQGGYGLGLAIASTIVENHGGKIGVKSSLEQGTTFTVSFKAV